jgi:pimeloyl-ACP methyl ester carboxylesterase
VLETFFEFRRQRASLRPGLLPAFALLLVSAVSAQVDSVELPLEPCHLDNIAEWVQCGTFEVPENYQQPDGRRISLRVAVLPSFAQPAKADPVFMLAGGPGQSAVAIAALVRHTLGKANQQRDIVLVDQRGTGQSNALDCDLDFDQLAFDQAAKTSAIKQCLSELDIDPLQYSTMNHIRDLEAVREALGYPQVSLYGGSYGTRVAQVYMREFPQSVRTVIMDAVAPMNMRVGMEMGGDAQLALDAVFARCAEDAACAERYPDLTSRFEALMADLEANPLDVDVIDAKTGKPEQTPMDHRMFALGLRGLLYSPQTQRLVPLLIDQVSQGDWGGFVGLASSFTDSLQDMMTPGLLLAVLCTEDLATATEADIGERERDSFVGTAQIREFISYCAAWPKPQDPVDWSPPDGTGIPV